MRNFFQLCSTTCLKIILICIYEKDLKKGNSWDLGLLLYDKPCNESWPDGAGFTCFLLRSQSY